MADPLHYRDPRAFFGQIQDESNAIKTPPVPTMDDWWGATIPGRSGLGFLGHRDKTEEQRLNDFRKAYLLEKLVNAYGDPAGDNPSSEQWGMRQILPEDLALEMTNYARNTDGFKDKLNSGYEYTGAMGRGSTLSDFATWVQSMPASAYHAGEMLANQVDPAAPVNPDAAKDLERTLGTFSQPFSQYTVDPWAGSLTEEHTSKPGYSHWNSANNARESIHRNTGTPMAGPDAVQLAGAIESAAGSPLTGEEYLDRGADKIITSPAARGFLGAVMDDTLNPYWSGPAVIGAASKIGRPMARLGKLGPAGAWSSVAFDHSLGLGMEGVTTAAEALGGESQGDELIKRLGREYSR